MDVDKTRIILGEVQTISCLLEFGWFLRWIWNELDSTERWKEKSSYLASRDGPHPLFCRDVELTGIFAEKNKKEANKCSHLKDVKSLHVFLWIRATSEENKWEHGHFWPHSVVRLCQVLIYRHTLVCTWLLQARVAIAGLDIIVVGRTV